MAQNKQTKITDEERLKLAGKLDKELDEFINGLEKKSYTEGWPEDKWQEEFDKHPFFMKNFPTNKEDVSPLLEGLQKLKYDPEENTPEELAQSYKEDGNFNFKYKKYRMAIISYTEGLKAKCKNSELNALLYNNRAASHYFLKNYRSSLNDCIRAIELKPNYTKAIVRAANCAYHLEEYDKCITFADEILLNNAEHKEMSQLRKNAGNAKNQKLRDLRKKKALEKTKTVEENKLISEIEKRGIRLQDDKGKKIIDISQLEPTFPEISAHRVFLNSEDYLVWPVIFLYPEYKTMDFVQQFCENTLFKDHLAELFEQPPEWDENKKYVLKNIKLYFENKRNRKLVNVELDHTLGQILKHKEYVVQGGVPSFLLFVSNSLAEKKYLENN